eukprot:1923894-Pleurochrysis_carterae.AAC.3
MPRYASIIMPARATVESENRPNGYIQMYLNNTPEFCDETKVDLRFQLVAVRMIVVPESDCCSPEGASSNALKRQIGQGQQQRASSSWMSANYSLLPHRSTLQRCTDNHILISVCADIIRRAGDATSRCFCVRHSRLYDEGAKGGGRNA